MKEFKGLTSLERWGLPFHSIYDCILAKGINPTAAAEKVFNKFDTNGDGKISLSELGDILNGLGSATPAYEVKRIMSELDTDGDGFIDLKEFKAFHCGGGDSNKELKEAFDLYDKDKNGAHIEQAKGGYSKVKPWIEHTSKNEDYTGFKEWISDYDPGATRVRKLNKWQAAYERCLIALKALILGYTASDKETCSFYLPGWLHSLCSELPTNKLFSQAVIQLTEVTELLSASTKFVSRIKEGVAWIFSKNVFVLVLLISNLAMVTSVDTHNSTVVVSPPSLQPLNMARQLAPPPPPPMCATRRGFLPLGPPSPSVTESKTEWGLSPKPSPPSCLPDCYKY